MDTLFEIRTIEKVTKPKAAMFVDVDALREQMAYIWTYVDSIKNQEGQDRQIRYFSELYRMLHELYEKLRQYKSLRVDFWGQP